MKNIAILQKQYHLTTKYLYIAHLFYPHIFILINLLQRNIGEYTVL